MDTLFEMTEEEAAVLKRFMRLLHDDGFRLMLTLAVADELSDVSTEFVTKAVRSTVSDEIDFYTQYDPDKRRMTTPENIFEAAPSLLLLVEWAGLFSDGFFPDGFIPSEQFVDKCMEAYFANLRDEVDQS